MATDRIVVFVAGRVHVIVVGTEEQAAGNMAEAFVFDWP